MEFRGLRRTDEAALRSFFHAIPGADRAFLKEDLDDPAVLRRWIDDERGVRLVAVDDDGHLAVVAVVWPGVGRSSHVGDLRLVVAADRRRQGLGGLMARRVLAAALERGIWKLRVEVVSHHTGTIDMFAALGFTAEALLRDELCAPNGDRQDVVLLSHFADEAGLDLLLTAPD